MPPSKPDKKDKQSKSKSKSCSQGTPNITQFFFCPKPKELNENRPPQPCQPPVSLAMNEALSDPPPPKAAKTEGTLAPRMKPAPLSHLSQKPSLKKAGRTAKAPAIFQEPSRRASPFSQHPGNIPAGSTAISTTSQQVKDNEGQAGKEQIQPPARVDEAATQSSAASSSVSFLSSASRASGASANSAAFCKDDRKVPEKDNGSTVAAEQELCKGPNMFPPKFSISSTKLSANLACIPPSSRKLPREDVSLSQEMLDDLLDGTDSVTWRQSPTHKKQRLSSTLMHLTAKTPKQSTDDSPGTVASGSRTIRTGRRRPIASPAGIPKGEEGQRLVGVMEQLACKVQKVAVGGAGDLSKDDMDFLLGTVNSSAERKKSKISPPKKGAGPNLAIRLLCSAQTSRTDSLAEENVPSAPARSGAQTAAVTAKGDGICADDVFRTGEVSLLDSAAGARDVSRHKSGANVGESMSEMGMGTECAEQNDRHPRVASSTENTSTCLSCDISSEGTLGGKVCTDGSDRIENLSVGPGRLAKEASTKDEDCSAVLSDRQEVAVHSCGGGAHQTMKVEHDTGLSSDSVSARQEVGVGEHGAGLDAQGTRQQTCIGEWQAGIFGGKACQEYSVESSRPGNDSGSTCMQHACSAGQAHECDAAGASRKGSNGPFGQVAQEGSAQHITCEGPLCGGPGNLMRTSVGGAAPAGVREAVSKQVEVTLSDDHTRSGVHAAYSERGPQQTLCRCLVTGVVMVGDVRGTSEKVLNVVHMTSKEARTVVLQGSWVQSNVSEGDVVGVVAPFDAEPRDTRASGVPCAVIGSSKGLLVTNPDCLVSATRVGDEFACSRRPVIGERVSDGEYGEAAALGTMAHHVFQKCITARDWSDQGLTRVIDSVVQENLGELIAIGRDDGTAKQLLSEFIAPIQKWCTDFLRDEPSKDSPSLRLGASGQESRACITSVVDIEDLVQSPKYGIKGQIDACVELFVPDAPPEKRVVPLELKTGKFKNIAHSAQTILYALLMSEHEGNESSAGLLLYLKGQYSMQAVPIKPGEIQHIIQGRNRLAEYMSDATRLPPMLMQKSACERCFSRSACAVIHKLSEGGNKETSGMGDAFDEESAHLSPVHAEYFKSLEKAVSLEEQDTNVRRMQVWGMEGHERELTGGCVSRLKLISCEPCAGGWRYTFIRAESDAEHAITVGGTRLPLADVAPGLSGGRVLIRHEGGSSLLGTGTMEGCVGDVVSVMCHRVLRRARVEDGEIWRLDREEYAGSWAKVRGNLVKLFAKGGDERRRALVVDLEEPRFCDSSQVQQSEDAKRITGMVLNSDQQEAVMRCVCARDYALLLGMPGTGKTTTISAIVKALVALGKRVLVTAYTNNAVDNVLLKLKEIGVPFARIVGSQYSVHADLESSVLSAEGCATTKELQDRIDSIRVVGTTCLQTSSAFLSCMQFDYCIVDEASQVTQPVILGPLRLADVFILVGDHNQLPPLVQNKEAKRLGLDVSLFKRLSDAHPSSVVHLKCQYRMNAQVMALANMHVYDGVLSCGSEDVANRRLSLVPSDQALSSWAAKGGACAPWILQALDAAYPIVFIDTDEVAPQELRDVAHAEGGGRETRRESAAEALIVAVLVDALEKCGIKARDIGVISPYRAQLAAIENQLAKRPGCGSDVEVCTVDTFQGRDKECIILSFVRNNKDKNVGHLLSDWRRINVAITRARSKIILVGSAETLKGNKLLAALVHHAQEHGRFMTLDRMSLVEGTPSFVLQEAWKVYRKTKVQRENTHEVIDPKCPNNSDEWGQSIAVES